MSKFNPEKEVPNLSDCKELRALGYPQDKYWMIWVKKSDLPKEGGGEILGKSGKYILTFGWQIPDGIKYYKAPTIVEMREWKKKRINSELVLSIMNNREYRLVVIEIKGIDTIRKIYSTETMTLEDVIKSVNELILHNIKPEQLPKNNPVWEVNS